MKRAAAAGNKNCDPTVEPRYHFPCTEPRLKASPFATPGLVLEPFGSMGFVNEEATTNTT
jgi:hypothetical protein